MAGRSQHASLAKPLLRDEVLEVEAATMERLLRVRLRCNEVLAIIPTRIEHQLSSVGDVAENGVIRRHEGQVLHVFRGVWYFFHGSNATSEAAFTASIHLHQAAKTGRLKNTKEKT